jgi:cytochrome c1
LKNTFPKSKIVQWLVQKLRWVRGREYKNTIYNILTGYNYYTPPSEVLVPKGFYYNPYVKGMVTTFPPFLKDNMLEMDDGVKASIPQMAFDLTEFLSFLKYGHTPDRKYEAFT